MSELLPTIQANAIRDALLDYLGTTFTLADDDARQSLTDFVSDPDNGIFKGPYLRLRLPFRPADEGWRNHLDWYEGPTPYGHQAAAFARLSSADLGPDKTRPLPTLVTTGTGSGKTEAFLYPILDHVLRAQRAGVTGMKALILYPMNALANDQAARLAKLITDHDALAGVKAALYTGQDDVKRTKVSPEGLINDRHVIRDTAPDILLTNYKMLDQLLLRADDAPLWEQSSHSLQYLVLDEFHTYDGAQGTDVAMLLRRLGLALKHYWSDDDPRLTDADRARPLGRVTPVATSATLGDKNDPVAMLDFARTVFGEEFGGDAVITESRLTYDEWAAGAAERVAAQQLQAYEVDNDLTTRIITAVDRLPPDADGRTRAEAVLTELYSDGAVRPDPATADESLLLDLVKAHPLTRRLTAAATQAVAVGDLTDHIWDPDRIPADPDQASAEAIVRDVVSALSHVRAVVGRDALSVDTHLWIRELTRVHRTATPTPHYRWVDDGEVTEPDESTSSEHGLGLPAMYCRHCGRSGWGVVLAPTGHDLDNDIEGIWRRRVSGDERFRSLIYAPTEGDLVANGENIDGLMWFEVRHRRLVARRPDDEEELRSGGILPVLTHTTSDAGTLSTKDVCPSCEQNDGMRFLGSAIATVLSVSLSTIFGAAGLDTSEKKALVFTDSVQDAAHRAGFVQSRSHSLTLRAVFREAVGDQPINLEDLVGEVINQAGDDPHRRYRILPPEVADRANFEQFWKADNLRTVTPGVSKRVRRRLLLDAVLEFGLQSRVGRTLELTGSLAAEVSAPALVLARAADRVISEYGGTLDGSNGVDGRSKIAWARGVLERMRERGALEHDWFKRYINDDGARYSIWGGRPREQGMPAFPRGRAAPGYPRIGGAAQIRESDLDPVTSAKSWYAAWTAKCLGVPSAEGAKLGRLLLQWMATEGVITAVATKSGAQIYQIAPSSVLVEPIDLAALEDGRHLLTCTVCRTQVPGTTRVIDQLAGAPCTVARCNGSLERTGRGDNFYRQMYASPNIHRVVAREHTSLLEDKTRLAYEKGFRQHAAQPQSPNVLVATPTLEMGIDIGDLSTVMLASLPRSVASYLQRVGRAGRLTGNALSLAFVRGRGEQLPRLGDPLSVINGQVRPPATYLRAEEILRRQYLASVADYLARSGTVTTPQRASAALGSIEEGSWLHALMTEAEANADIHLDAFLRGFSMLGDAARDALRDWVTPTSGAGTSPLAIRLNTESRRFTHTIETLQYREKTIVKSLPELMQRAESPAATDDDKRAFRTAEASRRLVLAQLAELRGEYWIGVLEEFGLLPNYTLLDDTVVLNVGLSWIDADTGEYRTEPHSYQRGAAMALREFAPGSVFYAGGHEIRIDSVDLGQRAEGIHTVVLCPECGYCQDLTASAVDGVTLCPRCGSAGIADVRQRLEVVELERVSSEMRRDEAVITDRDDERHTERFTVAVSADIDPDHVTKRWYVEGYGFGAKHLRDLTIRWFNLGKATAHGGARTISGNEYTASSFRVCSACGKLDQASRANTRQEHRPWCPLRTATNEDTRDITLGRTLVTEGIVLRLPATVTLGDRFAVPSLSAAILLGLRERIGGTPDHIDVAAVVDPTYSDGSENAAALLLHDVVPGGTGYLAELADPAVVWEILHTAWKIVRDCECASEQRLACHRCLLPFTPYGDARVVSRAAAERHLRIILASGDTEVEPAETMTWACTEEQPAIFDPETVLEQRFRAVLLERLATVGAAVTDTPGPQGNRAVIRIGGSQRLWTLEPQQMVLDSRPDFVLRCDQMGIPGVAIFTDGWQYHASPSINRIAEDAVKRRHLRDAGWVVLAVTWDDLEQAQQGKASHPDWLDPAKVGDIVAYSRGELAPAAVELLGKGPVDYLVQWIQQPDPESMASLAKWMPFFLAGKSTPIKSSTEQPLARVAVDLLVGRRDSSGPAMGWAWEFDTMAVVARQINHTATEVALMLDDRHEQVGREHEPAWREWLRMSNLLNLRGLPVTVGTVSRVDAEIVHPTTLRPEQPAAQLLPAKWQALVDHAISDRERELLIALAERTVDPPPVQGFESADGIPIVLSWPDRRIAVDIDLAAQDRIDLEADHWKVVRDDPEAIIVAVGSTGGDR
ncbi:DEAD/DEAH box helicase [Kribbella sp. HUAS MG21]|uniref:DEAD/DEAH box helicase n=1 Tax=Kribbella sp. HUAS MG21 TaxID=3160966 RepID=A0AAU7THX6_9ACTN